MSLCIAPVSQGVVSTQSLPHSGGVPFIHAEAVPQFHRLFSEAVEGCCENQINVQTDPSILVSGQSACGAGCAGPGRIVF